MGCLFSMQAGRRNGVAQPTRYLYRGNCPGGQASCRPRAPRRSCRPRASAEPHQRSLPRFRAQGKLSYPRVQARRCPTSPPSPTLFWQLATCKQLQVLLARAREAPRNTHHINQTCKVPHQSSEIKWLFVVTTSTATDKKRPIALTTVLSDTGNWFVWVWLV